MKKSIKQTITACYIGFITQAIINNFAPLLYVTFHETYGISLAQISLLIFLNFGVQILVDLVAARFIGDSNTRLGIVMANAFSAAGLLGLSFLPDILPNAFLGICISVIISGIGGGLMEVLGSPILEALPGDSKSGAMSLLHSLYCWGQAGVILVSTVFFFMFGVGGIWQYLVAFWAIIPLVGMVMFMFVPLYPLVPDGNSMSIKALFSNRTFIIFLAMMTCAGASELAMAQWASTFAETALGIDKSLGDLLGPCMFAILMGSSRVLYAKLSNKINLKKFFFISTVICIFSYLLAALSPKSAVSLIGCALCGFGVGVMWPGTYSMAASRLPNGGVSMFAFLALAGDMGCVAGPALIGLVTEASGLGMSFAFLLAVAFPTVLLLLQKFIKTEIKKSGNQRVKKSNR